MSPGEGEGWERGGEGEEEGSERVSGASDLPRKKPHQDYMPSSCCAHRYTREECEKTEWNVSNSLIMPSTYTQTPPPSLTAYFQGGFQLQEDGLAEEYLSRFQTQSPDFSLCQLNILSGTRSTNWEGGGGGGRSGGVRVSPLVGTEVANGCK